MSEVVTGTLLLVGASFLLLAGVAVIRFPDFFMRLSACSKAVSLGAGVMFIAMGVYFPDLGVLTRAVAGVAFFLLTSPVSAHVMARAGYHIGVPFFSNTINQDTLPHRDDRVRDHKHIH